MIQFLTGNEPLLINEYKRSVIKDLENVDFNYLHSSNCGPDEIQYAFAQPFFSDRKVLALTLTDLSEAEEMSTYFESPAETTYLLITSSKVDKRGKIYKLFKNNGWIKEFDKVDVSRLRQYILSIIKKYGGAITEDAFSLLLKRLNYQNDENCNLYTVRTRVKEVLFFNSEITVDVVNAILDKTIDEDIFALSNHLLKGDRLEVFSLVQHLLDKKEQPIAILSLLLRNFRVALKAQYFSNVNQAATEIGVSPYQLKPYVGASNDVLTFGLELMQSSIRKIKQGVNGPQILKLTLAMLLEKL